jgi:hypothetical protein
MRINLKLCCNKLIEMCRSIDQFSKMLCGQIK